MKRTLLALSVALVVIMIAGTAMAQSYHRGPRHQQVIVVQGFIPGVGVVQVTQDWNGPYQNFGPRRHFGHRRHFGRHHHFRPHHHRHRW